MRKKLHKKAVKLATSLVKHMKLNAIIPFQEQPSPENDPASKVTASTESDSKLGASDLFSLFTADIIKKEVIFTR